MLFLLAEIRPPTSVVYFCMARYGLKAPGKAQESQAGAEGTDVVLVT